MSSPVNSHAPPRQPPTTSGGGTKPPENVVLRHDGIVKSQEDKREYRGLELSNRLKVMLVSDPSTDKSAAALDVNVGYLSDPEELPGLAHFCEHMLFLGTKKYPEENEYSKFLSEHGGSSNASTSSDHTTYYFDVLPAHLPRALDIFAQFFISPLFTEGATGRELNAVNSEHEKNTSSDTWRLDQLNKNSADPKHPYHKFGTGNKQTLETIPKEKGIDVRKELLKFHDKWYSSNIMTLVVIGKETLDELESIVVPLFSQILDESVSAPTWPEHPFPPHLRRKRTYCVPVKDLRSLSIDFPVPDTRKYYKTSPGHYLSHLLGHEGPGSLLSLLKEKGWCNSLVGGTRVGARGFAFFGVQVDLTEEGMQHTDDIVQLVFEYIAMLRKAGAQRWIWEEQKDIMAMEFRFKDTQEPRSVVTSHVHLMQEFPIEDVLSAYYIVSEWKPELIDQLMSLLTPENCRIGVVAKSFESKCKETEPWYGTKYVQEDIEEALIKKWKSASPHPSLHLPPPNEFIPTSVEVVHPRQSGLCHSAPAIVRDTAMCRLWHKPDKYYALPKAVNTFDFISPLAYSDPLNCGLTSLWALLLRDSLQQTAYAAELAGLSWRIGNAKHGLTLYIDGYDSKQHVLLEKIIDQLVDFKIDPQRFEIMKENHIRGIRNFDAEQPYQHAVYQQALCLSDVVWTKCQLLDAAEEMTPEKLKDFTERFMRKVHVEGLIYGNITKEKAIELMESIEKRLPKDATPLLAQQLLLTREIELDKGIEFLRESTNSVHKSSCSCVYYAAGPRALRRNVSLELLAQITSEPCFNVLRTKEQLGYMVFSGVRRANGAQGLRILVQGDKPPAVLEERVEAFMLSLENILKDMTEEEFLKHRAALAAQRLETPKRLSTNAAIIWGEITSQAYNFDRARVEVEQLNTITKEELIEFYKNTISDETKRRKLCVRIASTVNENGENESSKQNGNDDAKGKSSEGSRHQPITDLVDFKSRRKLYPQTTPYTNIPRKGAHCKL